MTFQSLRPGAWLREDVADILTALALTAPGGEYGAGFVAGLVATGQALGLRVQRDWRDAVIEAEGMELTS